jgi:cell division protein FtsN
VAQPSPTPAQGQPVAEPGLAPEPAPTPKATAAKTPVEVPEPVAFTLQAGAFRDAADANRRRADITLLGYPARVEAISAGAGGQTYRVQVGPFDNAAALAGARGALKDQGIDVK